MKKLICNLIILTFLVIAHPYVAFSCSCLEQSVEDAFGASETVFRGTVKEIKKTGRMDYFDEEEIIVTFDVTKIWKGPVQKELVLHTVANKASCRGYWFEENKEYLVYAQRANDGTLDTSFCHRTTEIEKAQEDLQKLGEG